LALNLWGLMLNDIGEKFAAPKIENTPQHSMLAQLHVSLHLYPSFLAEQLTEVQWHYKLEGNARKSPSGID